MKKSGAILFLWLQLLNASGQVPVPDSDPVTVRSTSGQFIIYGARRASPLPRPLNEATNLVRLEPTLLAVSCERIKQALLIELDAAKTWRGKVYLVLRRVQSADDPILVNCTQFPDGWMYQIELPDAVEESRLVGAVTRVLLLEIANRSAGARRAELPVWLAEGLSQEIRAESEIDLVLRPPEQTINNVNISQKIRSARKIDPLTAAHAQLRSHSALTLEQLSWPTGEQLSGRAGELYRHSAQLFVHDLLELGNGRACLRTMVEQLPRDYNWQTTFLRAFRQYFKRQLDVEKWWALQVVHFTGRDLAQTWRDEESWNKLDEVVRPSVQVHVGTNELPLRAEVSLQTIIQEWDYPRQSRALHDKMHQLALLRLRISPDLFSLVDGYRQALEPYLQKRDKADLPSKSKNPTRPVFTRLAQETVARLDALDVQRQALREDKKLVTAADAKIIDVPSPSTLR